MSSLCFRLGSGAHTDLARLPGHCRMGLGTHDHLRHCAQTPQAITLGLRLLREICGHEKKREIFLFLRLHCRFIGTRNSFILSLSLEQLN